MCNAAVVRVSVSESEVHVSWSHQNVPPLAMACSICRLYALGLRFASPVADFPAMTRVANWGHIPPGHVLVDTDAGVAVTAPAAPAATC